jgi:chaperonin GroES
MTELKPLRDMIVIDRDPAETVHSSGLILVNRKPEEKAKTGTVVAVGPGVEDEEGNLDEMVIKPGDRVLFNPGSGQIFEVEKKKYLFLKQRDVMGRIN